ncbi:MAG: NAD(P)/FAD-dependent oxidoreductase, partial [Ktedonobacteraceae bacterium]|nr:NAD(P)/FAD-dependent oxidoreductase [Ktedonobacteraceae bacterium]
PKDMIPDAMYDVVIMGAGPYGLSTAAHLRGKGLKVAVFGKPLYYWRQHMPKGMLLRSYWWATSLSDPEGRYDFAHYFREKGIRVAPDPLPIEMFIDYGLWFQQRAVPDVDETYVANIERENGQFVVTLEDGRVVRSRAVVMAPGLHYYVYIPEEYQHLPSSLVSHTADLIDASVLSGKRVVVIGRGQSALEAAALLHEAGATVHVVSRSPLRWVKVASGKLPPFLQNLKAPKAGMGSGWMNLLLEKFPYTLQRMPRETIDNLVDSTHGPAGSQWLKPRLFGKVTILENTRVQQVEEVDGKVRLALSDGSVLEADHIVLGTGYKADVKRLPMLGKTLAEAIEVYRGSPVLNNEFQTNIPGLYFVGFSAARCFGPFYRFVVGAAAAARRVADSAARFVIGVR